jgi:hypothetical protein
MYSRHRFPSEIISYCVWLYYSFPLSYRDIEKMMLYRGVEVVEFFSFEGVRVRLISTLCRLSCWSMAFISELNSSLKISNAFYRI